MAIAIKTDRSEVQHRNALRKMRTEARWMMRTIFGAVKHKPVATQARRLNAAVEHAKSFYTGWEEPA